MKLCLIDFLQSNHKFSKTQEGIRHKFIFLNTIYSFSALVIFMMSLIRFYQESYIISAVDMAFTCTSILSLYLMRKSKEKIDLFSWILLIITYLMFIVVFIYAPTQPSRISIFFLLVGAAYFLQGKAKGFFWIVFILSSLLMIHFLTEIETNYSGLDFFMVSVYFGVFYFILNLYENVKASQSKVLLELNENLEQLVEERTKELKEAISDLEEEKKTLKITSITDPLTGLYNRLKIKEVFIYEQNQSKRYKNDFSIILMDLDLFKTVNDTYGHISGDVYLKEISQILIKQARQTDILARWGGEEFLLLLPNTPSSDAQALALRIKEDIYKTVFEIVGKQTASFGVASMEEDDTLDSFIQKADIALYKAKSRGRNCVEVFSQ